MTKIFAKDCMKRGTHLAVLVLSGLLAACGGSAVNDSVEIVRPTFRVETVFGQTFHGSGAPFVVNGRDGPRQDIVWTVSGGDEGGETAIVNGELFVAPADHGRTLEIRAALASNPRIYVTMTITAARVLPSDFHGSWLNNNTRVRLLMSASEVRFVSADATMQGIGEITGIVASSNEHEERAEAYPSGFFFEYEIVEDTGVGLADVQHLGFFLSADRATLNFGNSIYTRL